MSAMGKAGADGATGAGAADGDLPGRRGLPRAEDGDPRQRVPAGPPGGRAGDRATARHEPHAGARGDHPPAGGGPGAGAAAPRRPDLPDLGRRHPRDLRRADRRRGHGGRVASPACRSACRGGRGRRSSGRRRPWSALWRSGDLLDWAAADERFHQLLTERCGNRRLARIAATVRDQSHRARLFTLHLRPQPIGIGRGASADHGRHPRRRGPEPPRPRRGRIGYARATRCCRCWCSTACAISSCRYAACSFSPGHIGRPDRAVVAHRHQHEQLLGEIALDRLHPVRHGRRRARVEDHEIGLAARAPGCRSGPRATRARALPRVIR